MDLKFTEDQEMALEGLRSIVARHREMAVADRRKHAHYSHALDAELVAGGFLELVSTPGLGPLVAAAAVREIAMIPSTAEMGLSMLAGPMTGLEHLPRPFVLINQGIDKPQRNLPVARTAFLIEGPDVLAFAIDPENVETLESIYAYPMGRFRSPPDLAGAERFQARAERLRSWARLALAAESAGLMRSAIDFTVDYVKQRALFNTVIGAYQAVQHRLAQCHQVAKGLEYLVYKAAWSGNAYDADVSAAYAQTQMQKIAFDLQQFNGGMGITNEHLLHFWLYRLRALQFELGGAVGSTLAVTSHIVSTLDTVDNPRQAALA
jgi:alkylation response protein AidB-like acyl-CoA dehydrogenase